MDVTVFVAPVCGKCNMTKSHMKRRGVAFTETDLTDELRDQFKTQGFMTAPIVQVRTASGDEKIWAGYKPQEIDALA